MAYDLVLKGGEVIDPGWPFRGKADVAIHKGKIAAVQPDIPESEAVRVRDVSGKLVCPGLIDLHAHVFINAHDMGNETDQRCSASGVTTIIDAGSAGSATFPGLRQSVADRSEVRLRCFVHLSALGLIHLQIGELMHMAYADPEGCARTISTNRDLAIGVKLRFSNDVVPDSAGTEPLRLARQAADMAEVPLMVHITDALLPIPQILSFLKPGDVVTHCFHRYTHGIMGPDKKAILREVWDAQKEGIIFDCAHGRMHFPFPFVKQILDAGFYPDTIATDLSLGPVKIEFPDLPYLVIEQGPAQDGDEWYSSTGDRPRDASSSASSSRRQRPFCRSRRGPQANGLRPAGPFGWLSRGSIPTSSRRSARAGRPN